MVTKRPDIYWPWPLMPYNIKGPLPQNKLEISFNCLFLNGWNVMVKGQFVRGGLLRNEAVIDGRCQGSGLMLRNEAVADGRC